MRRTTYHPNKKRAKTKHGWRERMSSHNGKKVIARRKQKGRRKLTK